MSTIEVNATDSIFGVQLGVVTLTTHDKDVCLGYPCCIHSPSDHHMREWKMNWRADRKLMERVCSHGVGHPDPDHMSYVRRAIGKQLAKYEGVHGCDGCCVLKRLPKGTCKNCDGKLCMSCVLREQHADCVNDCPACCSTPLFEIGEEIIEVQGSKR